MADRAEFQKKLAELVAVAAADGNRMTQEKLAEFFREEQLTEEQMELVANFLMTQKIEVVGYTGPVHTESEEEKGDTLSPQEKTYVEEYLRDVANMDPKTEQEVMLAYYLPKVAEEAVRLHREDMFIGDLIQEGSLSLMLAMSEAEGTPSEEAILAKVRREMQMSMESQTEEKRQADQMVQKVNDLDETIRTMREEYGRKVSVDEVAERMQISEDDIADILKLAGEEIQDEEGSDS